MFFEINIMPAKDQPDVFPPDTSDHTKHLSSYSKECYKGPPHLASSLQISGGVKQLLLQQERCRPVESPEFHG